MPRPMPPGGGLVSKRSKVTGCGVYLAVGGGSHREEGAQRDKMVMVIKPTAPGSGLEIMVRNRRQQKEPAEEVREEDSGNRIMDKQHKTGADR